ncbi:hypothetical protein CBR_g46592 [Chara braunii]|uniref:Uncharacterized protein n=1 Tax=Chara braunii TaxID=69332 RepID=A0A388M0U8_CHABU|nr:hypothetical protein CBR_g46592 [Chara braunii]|eukprot:GBG88103.1 hypothetical protein CBR_g46592 [Chara braunii]
MQLAIAPSSLGAVVLALPAPVPPSDQKGHDAARQSSEATDYDDGAVRYRVGPRHRSRGGAGPFDDEECEGQDGEGDGWGGEGGGEEGEGGGEEEEGGGEGDDGNEGDVVGEDDGMDDDVAEEVEDNRSSQFHRRHQNESQGRREDDACSVGDAVNASDQPAASRRMSQSFDQTKDGGDEPGSRGKRKRGEASTSPASRTKQARADAVNEARGALTASQEARAPRKTGGGGRSGSRGGGHGGGRKGSQRSRAPELRDSGDEGEGDAVRDMRQWWIDNNRIEAPKAKVSEKDAAAVAHHKTWQNFLRACMGKACDKEFVKQALDNEHNKDRSNKLRGYLNLATSTRTVCPLVEKFFAMFEEGKLPTSKGKIPLEMLGRMEGRLPGPYTDENKGQRTLYHCIYARDGPKGSTVSWKDLCPTYFKNFGDMTCCEREVALLRLMSGKVVATKVRVTPPRVNTECLLDIMRKERYMVRMFNYIVFRTEGRAGDEWNDDFFMSYKDQKERYASNGLCADEWEKQRGKLHSNIVKTIPRRLGGVEEARQGAGLGPTQVMYKEAPFHFKVFIYTTIDKLDMIRAEVKRIASSACHLVWDKLQRQTTLLPVCMRSKEVMAAPVDIVAAAQKMTCRAAIVDISAANFSSACTSQNFDALYAMMAKCCGPNRILFLFAPQNVQSDVLRQLYRWEDIELIPRSWKRVDRPPSDVTRYDNIATSSRDLMAIVLHTEGGDLKKVTVAPRLHNDLTEVHVVEEKFGKCIGKHCGVEGDESAAYSIWEREPDKLRKLCSSFVGEAEGNNVIACDESAKDIVYLTKFVNILVKDGRFECRLEKSRATHRTNKDMYHKLGPKRLKVWEYMFRDAPDGRLDGGYIYRKAKVTEVLKHYHGALTGAFETFDARCEILRPVEDDEDDDLDIPAQPTKMAPGDPIPPRFCADPNNVYFLDDKYACTSEDKWGHDVISHDGIFEPCIQGGEWKMAMKYVSKGWRPFPRMGKDSWLKTTEQSILYRYQKENPGESETSITAKAKQLFDALGATRQLEYSHKFYELQSSPSYGKIDWKVERAAALESMDVDSREDAAPVPEAATGNTMGEQREDGGMTLGVKPPLPEAGNTLAGKNTIGAISVATGDTSQGEKVSLDKPADAGATYGSLLATGAALAGTSEMVSESTGEMGVTGMSLHPPTCTSKGDAHCTTTPQGGVTEDGGNGGNAGGSPRSRNIEDMTTDDEDGVEGGKGVSDPTRAKNEG